MTHVPVLLNEVIDGLDIKDDDIILDATVNRGGHSKVICGKLGKKGRLIGLDKDQDALKEAEINLSGFDCEVTLLYGDFRNMDKILSDINVSKVNKILLDIGISTEQIQESGRGFTFRQDEPLLMTMTSDHSAVPFTAQDIVNEWDEVNIADIIYGYGEERYSRHIARAIIEARKKGRIKTTGELVSIIEGAVPAHYRQGRIHSAARTFQALRIAVNDELNALREGLKKGFELLTPGGRMALITFHSLEARIAKFYIKSLEDSVKLLTKDPILPTEEEINLNPKSRSAQLRIIEKV